MESGTKAKRFLRRLQLFVMTLLRIVTLLGGPGEPNSLLLLCHLLENQRNDLIGSDILSFSLKIEKATMAQGR